MKKYRRKTSKKRFSNKKAWQRLKKKGQVFIRKLRNKYGDLLEKLLYVVLSMEGLPHSPTYCLQAFFHQPQKRSDNIYVS